jgi:O-antigen/teichoic acid export membrane protein
MSTPEDIPGLENLSPVRRAAKNFAKLLRGRGVAALLELLTIGLLARTLTPDELGIVVLVQTYALVVRGLLNFNVFEVLIRFGVPLLEVKDAPAFKELLRLTRFIDLSSTAVATVIAIAAAPLAGKILGWDHSLPFLAILYSVSLLTYGFGTAKGVLRIFDRYDALSLQLMIGPVLRLAGVLLALLLQPGVMTFVVALALATAAGNISLILRGWVEIRRQTGTTSFRGFSLKGWESKFPGLGGFMSVVYWQSNLDMMPKYLSTLMAGAFLGPSGAGYLRLAYETTKILSKPGALLRQVLYPDLVRMWVRQSSDFASLLLRTMLLSASVGLVIAIASIFGGSFLFSRALGAAYAEAAPLLTWILVAATLELMGTILRAAGYAVGHAGKILRLHLISAVIYLAAFVSLTPVFGLIGPGLAACIGAIVPLAGIGMLVAKSIRNTTLLPHQSA